MVTLVLSACPTGLRGFLTRWLLEISPGVFVGHVSARVREEIWARVVELSKDGRAIMTYPTRSEQRLAFRVHRAEWELVDIDGITLVRRPSQGMTVDAGMRTGWSNASKWRRARRK